jgi:mono/diheme cytochrome c family protein
MFTHFARIGEIQSALILADLERAQRAGRWMAEHPSSEGLAPEWDSYVNQMRLDARAVETSANLEEAALAASRLAQTCGACHMATGPGLRFVSASAPDQGDTRAAHMLRHLWAVDRMWEGLIAPSDDAWTAGADALTGDPLGRDELPAGYGRAAAIADRVHELGERAESLPQGTGRAGVYAELVTTCAQCHAMIGVGR